MASYMCTPVGGRGHVNDVETSFGLSENGKKSFICDASAPVLRENSSPPVGSDPKIIYMHNEEFADLLQDCPPLLMGHSELNQSAQSQEPHFLNLPEEEMESSFIACTEVNEIDPK